MAKVYHINGDSVSPCRAVKGQCPFGQGEEENHFDNPAEAMQVLEKRLDAQYNSGLSSVKKSDAPAKTAKELLAEGAHGKEVRDALRKENPSWGDRQVHTVYGQMQRDHDAAAQAEDAASGPAPTPVKPKVTRKRATPPAAPAPKKYTMAEKGALMNDIREADYEIKELQEEYNRLRADVHAYDAQYGDAEGRAYHYDYSKGFGRHPGRDPKGGTSYYHRSPEQKKRFADHEAKMKVARKRREDAQTAVEEAGLGHIIPDDGNTIRVKTQAQKWLLKKELQGQISDGYWENTTPHNHWEPWSNATVIVDPQNPGRNFYAVKDNYQLNSSALLNAVGDRMVAEVKTSSGKDYDEKQMQKDLRELRGIFKTKRDNRPEDPNLKRATFMAGEEKHKRNRHQQHMAFTQAAGPQKAQALSSFVQQKGAKVHDARTMSVGFTDVKPYELDFQDGDFSEQRKEYNVGERDEIKFSFRGHTVTATDNKGVEFIIRNDDPDLPDTYRESTVYDPSGAPLGSQWDVHKKFEELTRNFQLGS